MRLNSKLLFAACLAVVLSGCGTQEEPTQGTSGLHYITFGPGVTGLVAKVKNKSLKACLSGHSSADRQQWVENIQSSILKWVEPLRRMTKEQLFRTVEVIDGSGRCDTDIVIAPNTHSNTSVGRTPTVRMSPTGYFASYNVLLHEFGHAFALSDTYQNGQSGNCQPNQPQAVMCNTRFADLQTDDVAGVQEVFKRTFPGDTPSDPSQGGSVVEPGPLSVKFAVAMGRESSGDSYEIVTGITGTDAKETLSLKYCIRSCEQESSWARMAYVRAKSGAYIFSAGSHKVSDAMKMRIRAVAGERKKEATVEFRAI